MTKSETEELAERCEKATGPLRELELDIHETLFGRGYTANWFQTDGSRVPRYTASLEAAMTLVPEGCQEWHCGRNIKTGKGQAYLLNPATMRAPIYVHAETPALALCAAALRATLKEESNATDR